MIRTYSVRCSFLTIFSILTLSIAALAQEPVPAAQPGPIKDSATDAAGVVIPPAPAVIKRNPNSVAIPAAAEPAPVDGKKPRFEERAAVATSATVGSHFGYRRDPFTRRAKFHSGLDIKARWGDSVGASRAGVVQFAGWYHGYGNMIIVEHGGGVATHYAHLSSFAVEVGQKVERGTIVGYAGSTGRATSPHLHYEVRIDGNAINPLQQIALDSDSPYFKSDSPSKPDSQSPKVTAKRADVPPAIATDPPVATKAEPQKSEAETRPRRALQTKPRRP